MVEIKIRNNDLSKLTCNIDIDVEGTSADVIKCLIELERGVIDILEKMEHQTTLHLHEAFIGNLIEHFSNE